jgi:hypothetical protein
MLSGSDKRRFLRTKFDSRVKLEHAVRGSGIFRTGDVSDGGIYIQLGPFELDVADEVTVQIQDVPVEAPLVRMIVVRRDGMGYGLRFAD